MPSILNYDKSSVKTVSGGIEIEVIRENRNDDTYITFIPYKQIRSVKYIKRSTGCCNETLCVLLNDTWINIPLNSCEAVSLYNTIRDQICCLGGC